MPSASFLLLTFILFLGLYWRLGRRGQNLALLAAGAGVYSFFNIRTPFVILIPAIVDFFCGYILSFTTSSKKRVVVLLVSVMTDAALLLYFKYTGFFVDNVKSFLSAFGAGGLSSWHIDIILPVGISYYLFKSMSYTIDVYRKVIEKPFDNIADYLMYLSFFPQLLAGPIERAADFLPQIRSSRKFDPEAFCRGSYLILWGAFKKFFVADNLAFLIAGVNTSGADASGADILLSAYAFTFCVYADFSGYSDMAIGAGKCLGFDTKPNFNLPFFAKSPQDIWRRWHISLSGWFRDYVLYYLNRLRIRSGLSIIPGSCAAVIVTMGIVGLWHGAAWPYILWGVYHGVLISAQVVIRSYSGSRRPSIDGRSGRMREFFKIFFTFHLFVAGEMLFMAESARGIGGYIGSLLFNFKLTGESLKIAWAMLMYVCVMAGCEVCQYLTKDEFAVFKLHYSLRYALYVLLVVLLVMFGHNIGMEFFYAAF